MRLLWNRSSYGRVRSRTRELMRTRNGSGRLCWPIRMPRNDNDRSRKNRSRTAPKRMPLPRQFPEMCPIMRLRNKRGEELTATRARRIF